MRDGGEAGIRARGWGAMVVTLALCAGACRSPEPPVLRIVAHAGGFTVPDSVEGGLVRVRLVNQDTTWHEAMLTRLSGPEGTLANYAARVMAGDEYPEFATDVGGPTLVAGGDSLEVMIELPAARYLVLSWYRDDAAAGFAAEFAVTAPRRQTRAPDNAQQVILSDYAISPMTASRGEALLQVVNSGPSTHEMTILRLDPGKTAEDYYAWREHGAPGGPPARPVAGTAGLAAGGQVWIRVNWEPGQYLATCAVETTGANPVPRHHTLGMEQLLTVPK